MRVLVSACLCGCRCTYRGGEHPRPELARLYAGGKVLPVCPEVLGGLPIPRPAAEICGGDGADVLAGRARVMTATGHDVTAAFLLGARRAADVARAAGIRAAVLKARSPSCGCGVIYDGSFSRSTRPGDGVAAALLRARGMRVFSDEEWEIFAREVLADAGD